VVVVSHTVCAHVGGPKNSGILEPNHLGRGVADPLKTRSSPTRVTIPNFVAVGQTVWGMLGPRPLGMWAWLTPRNVSSHLCYLAKFGHSRSNHTSAITIPARKFWPFTPPFKFTQDQNRHGSISSTYDFLLVFHIRYIAPSRSVFEVNGDICKIFPPLVFNAPLRGFPLEFCNCGGAQTELVNIALCMQRRGVLTRDKSAAKFARIW